MQNKIRACAGGLALLAGATVLCARDGTFKAQRRLDYPGYDHVVGRVWFNIEKTTNDHAYFKALVQPVLGMGRIEGQGNLPLGLVQCTVIKRTAVVNPEVVLDVTMAKCPGGLKFAVDEVLFEVDNPAPKPAPRDEIPPQQR